MGRNSIATVVGGGCVRPATQIAPARRVSGWPAAALTLAVVAIGLLPGACGQKADSEAPFQMSLNGNPYLPGVGQPLAAVNEIEAGFSNLSQCTIIFPLRGLKNRPQPGLEIIFNPAVIPVGDEVTLGVGGDDLGIQLAYYPFFGGMSNDGKRLVYAIGDEESARIRFDDLDVKTRHVQGVLLEADLCGRYVNADGEAFEPKKPMKMHLSNFPFDIEFSDELW
jgi:hypothetical protein